MKWSAQEVKDLKLGVSIGLPVKEIASILNRTYSATRARMSILGLKSSCTRGGYSRKSHETYEAELPKSIQVLEGYVDTKTKILHRHSCGHEWRVRPNHILRGRGCPKCAKYGFNTEKPAIAYLIQFNALSIYKVGVTNRNIKDRFSDEPQPYEVVLERYFEKGSKAKELETIWLSNLKPFLYNTNELKDGNTETFIYD